MEIFEIPACNSDMSLYETTIRGMLEKRILIINDEISDNVIENYVAHIIRWNMEDVNIPKEKRKKITILINSAGGDVFTGFCLISAISASTTPVVAIGMGIVASMAYHIFISCHERYAFSTTVLLQHDGEIAVCNSTGKAKDTMKFFDKLEERTKQHVIKYTKMTEDFYNDHYDQEFYMFADEDGINLGCVDKIINSLDEVFE